VKVFRTLSAPTVVALLLLVGLLPAGSADAQNTPLHDSASRNIPAFFISDIHFDPFHDPAKVPQLVAAPVSQWASILSTAPSPDQQQAFASLQKTCDTRGVDTPYALLESSLKAMQTSQPDAKFITITGDLIAHSFSCKYTTLVPESNGAGSNGAGGNPAGYQAFVLKTIAFVLQQLRSGFPGVPIYTALGNNDTACGDYQLDPDSAFLAETGKLIAEDLPASQRSQAVRAFAAGGYYSVAMAAPMRDTRLIVVNDLFRSPKYRTCAGASSSAGADIEMTWLEKELEEAQHLRQKVWVIGHIPPGIDPYSTVSKFKDVCGKDDPVMFLSSDKMANLLIEHAAEVRLAIFAHTHMDEIRLLSPQDDTQAPSSQSVALRIVPSISPVDGNNPSFTIARIDPASSVLQDDKVIAASNQTGIDTTWSTEYDYAQSYHQTQFSPAAVSTLIAEFESDHGATTQPSQDYIHNYFVGATVPEIKPFWPQYVCALGNHTAKGYAACVCSPGK
jgi:sphingomyelin phosphodiesterase acid-like 3